MRKGRDGENGEKWWKKVKKKEKKITAEIVATTSLPVDRLTAINCNNATRANLFKQANFCALYSWDTTFLIGLALGGWLEQLEIEPSKPCLGWPWQWISVIRRLKFWLSRPRLVCSQSQFWDWVKHGNFMSFNFETESETVIFYVSASRSRPRP